MRSNERRHRLLLLAILGFSLPVAAHAESFPDEDFKPLLPPFVYAVQGIPFTIVYDNLVLTEGDESVTTFSGACEIGHQVERTWVIDGEDAKPGNYTLTLSALTSQDKLEKSKTQVILSPPMQKHRPLRFMIVGDSLTNATYYPNRIASLLTENGHSDWTMIGTRSRSNALPGVKHEGYGGRAWPWFVRHYEPNPDPANNRLSSPFVFPQLEGKPKLDVARYFEEHANGEKPDAITILLGINDCFTASNNPDKLTAEKIRWMLENADLLIDELRRVCPKAKIGICITPPPNSRESAFVENYKEKYPRKGWQIVLRQLQKAEIEHFQERENENISLIPIELSLDTTAGFPDDNAVHPNELGYNQIGDAIYSWIAAIRQ